MLFRVCGGGSAVWELGKSCSWKKLKLLKIFQPGLRSTDAFRLFGGKRSKIILLMKAQFLLLGVLHIQASELSVHFHYFPP